MREYINRLSRGKFRYDIPDIIQPDDVIIEDVICDTIHNAESVSYTHLDVYKRQVL